MNSTYAQKSSTVQKAADTKAASVLDSSAQSESLQRKADMANNAAQRAEAPRPNNTGMPDNLKAGIESLSGFSMDDVRVHYNSPKPATVQALAYTQGTDIHVAPGQEKCLPHEAWHVAQQMAGRVSPTTNINGMPVNDNATLEHEADVMGEKAVQCKKGNDNLFNTPFKIENNVVQCENIYKKEGKEKNVSDGTGEAVKKYAPHIAFETLAGGGRVSELGGLYDKVIKTYDGKASVYMGVNACVTNYKKIGNDLWSYEKDDADKELDKSIATVDSAVSGLAKGCHKITLIPFLWSLVGLKSAGDKYFLSETQISELMKGTVPKVLSKNKNGVYQKEVMNYKDVDFYNFPFYEARAYIMEKAAESDADLYRWIDSDVRNDSSIEQMNTNGCLPFLEGMDGVKKEDSLEVFKSKKAPQIFSGFYKWRQQEHEQIDDTLITMLPLKLTDTDGVKKAVLGIYLNVLNEYEGALRKIFWDTRLKNAVFESKIEPSERLQSEKKTDDSGWNVSVSKGTFKKEGYVPEPIVYMNPTAHENAMLKLEVLCMNVNEKHKQDEESKKAFEQIQCQYIDSFFISKPLKDYFNKKELNNLIDPIVGELCKKGKITDLNRLLSKIGGLEKTFENAIRNSHQSAFGKWLNWNENTEFACGDLLVKNACLKFENEILKLKK